jgi:autotransporter-associated beta strand protein
VKGGTGTLTLTGANTYTGSTNVASGTLGAAAAGALGSTSEVIVNNGGTLLVSGSGNLNRINDSAPITLGQDTSGDPAIFARSGAGAVSEGAGASRIGSTLTGTSSVGLGALTLQTNSILDFGSAGVGTFTFSSFTPNGNTLNILNWTSLANATSNLSGVDGIDDRLIFNEDQSSNIAFFNFNGLPAAEITLDSGFFEIVAVPEPSTWVGAALACSTIAFSQRRRFARRRSQRSRFS